MSKPKKSKRNGHEPFWRASKNAWYLHHGGRMVSLGRDKAAAWDRWHELQAKPAPQAGPCRTVGGLIDQYLRYSEVRYRKDGAVTGEFSVIAQALRRFRDKFGDLRPETLARKHLREFQSNLIAEGLAKSTILHYCDRVRRMIKWAAGQELVPLTVEAEFIARDKGLADNIAVVPKSSPVTSVESKRIEAIREHVSELVWDMVQVALHTGMRPGEVCILRRKDIDMTGDVWTYRPHRHKLEHKEIPRAVAIGPKAQAVLKPWLLKVEADEYCFPMRRDSFNTAIRRGCEEAFGMPKKLRNLKRGDPRCAEAAAWREANCWSANQLRHSQATAIRKELGLVEASAVLGHTSLQTTLIYAERNAKLAAEVAMKIG